MDTTLVAGVGVPPVGWPAAHTGTRTVQPPARNGAIDGLRGLALLLVVAFHLFGQGRVSGGVDVFLLLSGYFATGSLLRRAEAGRLRLSEHYARTLARLLPAALVVLAAVTIALITLAPRLRWSAVLREIGASATFWENWELVRTSLAYGAAGPGASPLQHFWSLSVQGQFFAVWPPTVLGLVIIAQRLARSGRTRLTPVRLVAAVTGAATAASFGYALWLVTQDQTVAYFSTFARFWEIGAGALLALALRSSARWPGRERAPRQARWHDGTQRPLSAWCTAGLGWAGLALVVGSGFLVDGADVFPGAWALVPTGGAALVLSATGVGARTPQATGRPTARSPLPGVERLLDSPPLRFGARIAYALYLWHWPLLVFWLELTGAPRAGIAAAAGIVVASTVLAWTTTRHVAEPLFSRATHRLAAARIDPVRPLQAGDSTRPRGTSPGRQVLRVLVGAAVLILAGSQAAAVAHDATVRRVVAELRTPSPDHPGAAALALDAPDPVGRPGFPFRPPTWAANEDHPDAAGCTQGGDRSELRQCALVSPLDPAAVVYVVGASHEQQYQEAFVALARENGWELHAMIKHSCRLATSGDGDGAYSPSCAVWNERALDFLVAAHPDVVVVVGTRTYEDGSPERVLPGQVDAWRILDDAGISVVTLRDNPRFEWFVPVCMDDASSAGACGRPREEVLAATSPVTTASAVPDTAVHLDLTDSICRPERCDAVVGNVLVYRDDDHLTNTYVRTLVPALAAQLRSGAPWLFDGSGR